MDFSSIKAFFYSIDHALLIVAILISTILVSWLFNKIFGRLIRRSSLLLNNDPTNYQFLKHSISALIYIIGFSTAVYMIPSLRALASSLLAGAGILAIAVGFASQQALSNIISGMFIVIFKPFRVGDRIKLRELSGIIEDITLRHTIIRDFENRRIIIPNAVISDEIIVNADIQDNKICKWIEVNIAYDSDIDTAKRIMAEEVVAHPYSIDNRSLEQIEQGEPLVAVRLISLLDSSMLLRAYAWARDSNEAFILNCDLNESIKKRFDSEGVEIPFPHYTISIADSINNLNSTTD